jgi:hypothetical protein
MNVPRFAGIFTFPKKAGIVPKAALDRMPERAHRQVQIIELENRIQVKFDTDHFDKVFVEKLPCLGVSPDEVKYQSSQGQQAGRTVRGAFNNG